MKPLAALPGTFTDKNGNQTSFSDIHKTFLTTSYGKTLTQAARFVRFKPDHWSNRQWECLLGADVNNASHMPATYGLGRVFLRYLQICPERQEKLSIEDIEIILLACKTHDWAEAITGDTTYDHKTDHHEKIELTHMRSMLEELEGDRISEQMRQKILDTIFVPTSKLSEIFGIIEKIGYLRTAIFAWEKSHQYHHGLTESENNNLKCGTAEVFGNIIGKSTDLSRRYSPMNKYLVGHTDSVTTIFETMPEAAFNFYPEEQIPAKITKFNQAKGSWFNWLAQRT